MKEKYESACLAYVKTFAKVLDIEFDNWVGDNVGEVANFSDESFYPFEVIKYFIDNGINVDTIHGWHEFDTRFGNHFYVRAKSYVSMKSTYIDFFVGFGDKTKFKFNADKFHLKIIEDKLFGLT